MARHGPNLKVVKARLAVAGAVVVVIAGLAWFGGAQLLASHRAPAPLALSATPTSGSSSALSGKWSIGPGSQVGYRVKEKFINQPAETEAVARTSHVTGSVVLAVDSRTIRFSQVKLSADLASLVSQDKYSTYQVYQRDFFIRSIYLQTNAFPTATFTAPAASFPLPATGPLIADVAGSLTAHGVTKGVTAHISAVDDGGAAEVAGSMTVDMRDFGIEPPDISFTRAEPSVLIEFDLRLVRG